MKVEFRKSHISDYRGNLLCVFLMQDEEPPHAIREFGVKKERYEGKLGQTYAAETQGKAQFRYLLVVGLGKKEDFRADNLRRAAGTAVRFAASIKEKEFAMHVPAKFLPAKEMDGMAQAMAEGATLAAYKFTEYKTKKDDLFFVEKALVISETDVSAGIHKGSILAGAQNYARAIDEQPANIMSPAAMAAEARALARSHSLAVSVMDRNALKRMGMNGILAVCQGSRNEPYLVKLEYNKDKKYPLYCIVGKGVTFDTGGISIKPAQNMHEMKYDKTGAVNVLGIMKAVAELKLPIRLVGLMPLVENMPSHSAQRPGDIIKAYNGKTIEVLNTDAEGRLILADALAYGAQMKPEYMIDMATLTGAMIISLGRHAIGMMSNDDALSAALRDGGERAFERVWRLPLWPEYGELMKSDLADLKNISEVMDAGSITAAAFLQEFVGDTKWAHLDIAAVDTVKWAHPYLEKGATCMGVRLVTETLASFAK
ncbi:MAG TPA: leucyl aminopeptidase [Candidatus Bilamarchaeum sp.]|nr:leucyl aminopeptidase [Candidatus Bilamarchaeum sp.]